MGLISVLTDDKNLITKTILNKELDSEASGHIVTGTGQTSVVSLEQLGLLIPTLTQHQCLCTGVVEAQGLDEYEIFSKSKAASKKNAISRTSDHFTMSDQEGFMLFDIDGHDLSPVLGKLEEIDQGLSLSRCGRLTVPSASSWLWDADEEVWLREGKSSHVYVEVTDGSLIQDYGQQIFKRLILNGHGTIHVVKTSGAKLLRTMVDAAVWKSPNREIFEANPVCCKGVSSKRLDKVDFNPGPKLDIERALARITLTPEEEILYLETVQDLKDDPEVCKKSAIQRRVGLKIRATRSGCSVGDLIKSYEDEGMVLGATEVIKDNKGQDLPISDILASPSRYKNQGIPDPIDFYKRGDPARKRVGTDIARIRYDENSGRVFIFSFFGDIEYDLLWDFKSILTKLNTFKAQDDMEEWLDELFDVDSGCSWMGYRLTPTELSEVAKVVAGMNKDFKKAPNATPSKYGTDATSSKAALKALNNIKTSKKTLDKPGSELPVKSVPMFITKINKNHGIGMYGGKAKIITEEFKEDLHFWEPRFIDIAQLKTFHAEERTTIFDAGRPREVDIFSAWEVNSARNKYDRIIFQPRNDVFRGCGKVPVLQQGGKYNMWMGFLANLDNAKSCKKILWHLRYVWCGGNTEWYMWLLAWLARLFQKPQEVGQPFIVLKSLPGAGKNIIVDSVICRLLGIHAISTSNKKDIIGDFNHRLGMNVFCFLNEAFFAGDKSDRSAMKTMIDEHRTVTKKYADSEHSRNMTKVMIASNEENVTGAEVGDRRYRYLPMSDRMKGNTKYFKELKMEIEDGGRESFLKFMLKHESKIDLNSSPTSGESSQRLDDILFGAETPVQFLYDLVKNGLGVPQRNILMDQAKDFAPGVEDDLKALINDWDRGDIIIGKDTLLTLYLDYCTRYKVDSRYGRRNMQSLFKTYGSTGIQIYASNRASKRVKDNMPMAVSMIQNRAELRLWKRGIFLEYLEHKILS